MNCKNCNAVMRVDTEKKIFVCPYCDTVEPFEGLSNQALKEELKGIVSEAIRDANQNGLGAGMGTAGTNSNAKAGEHRSKGLKAKDVAILILQIFFCVILLFPSILVFEDGFHAVGLIALIQLILMIVSIACKLKYRKNGNKELKKLSGLCAIVVAVLVFVWFGVLMAEENGGGVIGGSGEEVVWPAQGMGSELPVLPGTLKRAYSGKDSFNATSKNVNAKDFQAYVDACKEAGYKIDAEAGNTEYLAYDENDNKLKIDYWAYSNEINLQLSEGIKLESFQWYDQGVAAQVPKPTAEKSYTEQYSKDHYEVYVGDVTREEFVQYAEECIRAGFDGRVHKDEFYGTKVLGEKDNLHISIELQRGRIMYIRIYESDY